jgi:hypothetical protein
MKIRYTPQANNGANTGPWLEGVLLRESRDGGALIRTADGETVWRRHGQWREASEAA